MKKIYALLLFIILINFKTYPQYFIKDAGGVVIDEGLSIATTPAGVSYVTGYYSGTGNIGAGNFTSAGLTDGFVMKIDATGNFAWSKSFGGTGIDKGVSIAVDNNENVYVAIAFESSITIDTNTIASFGLRDILIAKYSPAGNLLWTQQAGGTGNDNVTAIAVDALGNIAITGSFAGMATFGGFVLNSTINPSTSNPSADIFIAKLNSIGVFLWSRNGIATKDDNGCDVAFDNTGAVYLNAQFSDTLMFDAIHYNTINNAVCLLKFDASGNELWFVKFVGTTTQPTSIAIDAYSHVIATGNFTGTLNVFSNPFTTLSATYLNRYYVMRFSNAGNLSWLAAKSSDGPVSANDVVMGTNNSINIIGDFKCRMNDFADVYGQGTFNSVGYGDVFASIYDSSGTWQLARQCGGTKDDAAYSAAIDSNDLIYFTGSFEYGFNAPIAGGIGCIATNNPTIYCNDSSYNTFCTVSSSDPTVAGNLDILAARCFDLSRQPYDYYLRAGTGCVRDALPICINEVLSGGNCIDTILVCANTYALLNVATNYSGVIGVTLPNLNYQWSNGNPTASTIAYPGTYTVTVTTEDGCFVRSASVYVGIKPSPPLIPLISDSKGININAYPTTSITLCAGDSVTLWATNIAPGFTYNWNYNGVNYFNDTITVTQAGVCSFIVGGPNECPASNLIAIIVNPPIDTTGIYKIRVDNDYNQDDTVVSCGNAISVSFVDSLTLACFTLPVQWSITPACSQITGGLCGVASSTFFPQVNGLYTITAIFIINDSCNHDTIGPVSKQVYFIKLAVPVAPTLSITGITELCPSGDTTTLICDTAPNYFWYGTGIISNDTLQSVQVNQTGIFTVTSTVISVDGCLATGSAFIAVNYKSNPVVSILPAGGVICPNDSVMLTCYTPGSYQWIGPSGSLSVDSFIVYASQPGNYYCIVTDTGGCVLVSNTVVALSYSSPSLLVTPSNIICNGSSVTVQVIAGDDDVWQWQPPLSGNAPSIIVDTAGTYTCAFLSCGNTIIDSVIITSAVFPSSIGTGGSSIVCFGDSVLLLAPAGYSYLWFPTGDTTQSIYATAMGFYKVQLTDSMGCFDFTDSAFVQMVSPPALPVLSSNSPVCEGDSIQLNGTGSPGMSYNWSSPSGFSSTLLNPLIANASLADSGTYFMNVLYGACSSDTATINITVIPKPGTPVAASNSPLCAGDTLMLTTNGASLQSYQWSGPLGFSSTLQNPVIPNLTISNGGSYSVIGFEGTCYSDSVFINVQVDVKPLNPVILSNSPLCEGDTLQFNVTSAALNFNWNGPGGFTSTQLNPAITNIQLSNAGTYYLLTSNGNCFSDTVAYTVTVNPTPPSPVASVNSPLCVGDNAQLNCTAAPSSTVLWNGPNGFTSSISNPQITNVQLQNGGWYYVTATLGSCSSLPDSVFLAVNPVPPLPTINGNTNYCENDTIVLNANAATNYNWQGPNGFTSSQQQIVIYPATISNAGVYQLITDNGFCFSPTASITVSINPPLSPPAVNAVNQLCEGDTLQLSTTVTGVSYQWTGPSGFTSTDQNPVVSNVTLSNAGNYSLVVSNGCESPPSSLNVSINKNPNLTNISSNAPVCEGDELQLTFTGTDYDSVYWNFSSAVLNGNPNLIIQNAQVINSGIYVLNLLNVNCKNSDSLLVEIKECDLIIPNVFTPNNDGFNDAFEIESASIENIKYKIFDRWGMVVYEGEGHTLKWNGKSKGTGKDVPSGAYYYIFDLTFTDKTEKEVKGYFELLR